MHIKINQLYQVVEMTLTTTLHGPWIAYVQVDTDVELVERLSLTIGDVMEFVGTADRTGVHLGRARIRLVGGANGLERECDGKTYYRAPLRAILGDMLAIAGETLSSLSSQAVLSTAPKHWARATGLVREEIDVIAERFGFSWRILPNGEFWVGEETWDNSPLVDNYQLLRDEREDGLVEIASDFPTVLPGETFLERRVSEVEHTLSKSLRTEIRFL
jgi:hypothetical protein